MLFIFSINAMAQEAGVSAIRGRVIDKQSQYPLPGVSVVLLGSTPLRGVASDLDGYFRLENIPAGRHSITVSFIGYENQLFSNLLVNSGKDLELNVELVESVAMLDAAEITAKEEKHESLNKMSSVSARSFTVEEAMRYSGSLQDPARMAQNFAGVSNASDDRNDIIIRGNSPSGVLWRMEGIDIPSPNHFATLGTTGGPVSMLNINNLANSDFITGAFAPEYGNALAGVFDLKLRSGNVDNYEFLGQIGFNGFEFGAEGPLKITKNSSFLINYRYSTLGVLSELGVDFGTGSAVPQYQDITFKIDVPTSKLGRFTVFGVGGKSFIEFLAEDATDQNLYSADAENSEFSSETYFGGISHTAFFGEKTRSNLVIAASHVGSFGTVDSLGLEDAMPYRRFGTFNTQDKVSANLSINHKFNSKHTLRVGVIADHYLFELRDSVRTAENTFFRTSDSEGNADLMQAHINWQSRWSEKLTLNLGFHQQLFLLNESLSLEPRVGMRYKVSERHTVTSAVGLHSQMQPLPVYFNELRLGDGNSVLLNNELDFNRSVHFIFGHEWLLTEQFRIKSEAYYQQLYNIAIDRFESAFSILNAGTDFGMPGNADLVNEGEGFNYGLELTAERFFNRGYYFLSTVSLFQSKYQGSNGVWHNTAFNGNYVFNVLGGKEFKIKTSNSLSFDTKITYAGGRWYTPIDLEASRMESREIRPEENAFSEQYAPYFRADFKVTYRINKAKWAQQFSVDFRNLTGQQNVFIETFNARSGNIETRYQIGFFPDVQYRVYF